MKCSDATELIYLWVELAEQERAQLNKHIEGCEKCRELMESSLALADGIHTLATQDAAPVDATMLTNKVMTRVFPQEERKSYGIMQWFTQWNFIRAGLVMLSVVLVIGFYNEYTEPDIQRTSQVSREASLVHSGGSRTSRTVDQEKFSLKEKLSAFTLKK